jgi:hypothetical protein
MKTLIAVLVTAAIVALSACSTKNDGSQFVGKWVPANASVREGPFEIAKTGNTFLFIPSSGIKLPATYDPQNNVLTVPMPLLGPVPFSYDASAHKVLAMGDAFQRAGGGSGSSQNAAQDEAPANKLDKDALAFGKGLMTPKLTNCDGRILAMLTEGDGAGAPYLAEIKNPTFEVQSEPISKADEANGIAYHGSVIMRWEAFRVFQRGQWTQWFDPHAILTGLSVKAAEQVYVANTNGSWVHDISMMGKRDFVGMPRKPISCTTLPN